MLPGTSPASSGGTQVLPEASEHDDKGPELARRESAIMLTKSARQNTVMVSSCTNSVKLFERVSRALF
jgi:hypothetical protein